MKRVALLALAAAACAPHEREDSPLFQAPAADPMPDAPAPASDASADDEDAHASASAMPCEAAVADAPTALFNERVLVRMPKNVEILEENSTFAVAQASGGFVVTCDAALRRASLMIFKNDPKKTLGDRAREFTEALEKMGYVGARDMQWSERPDGRRGRVQIPAAEGQPTVELLVDLKRRFDLMPVLVYEAEPDDFAKLEPSIIASADSLLVAPPP